MDIIQSLFLSLCEDERIASVPVCNVLNALDVATTIGFASIIKGNRTIAIHNMNVLCNIDDVHIVNGKRIVIGNPCYIGTGGRLHIWQNTIAIAKADRAIITEIIGDEAIENAIYHD